MLYLPISAEKNIEVENEYDFVCAHPQLEIFVLYSSNSMSFGQVVSFIWIRI